MVLVAYALVGWGLGAGCFANPTPHPQEDAVYSLTDSAAEHMAGADAGAPSAPQDGGDDAVGRDPAVDSDVSEGADAGRDDSGDADVSEDADASRGDSADDATPEHDLPQGHEEP